MKTLVFSTVPFACIALIALYLYKIANEQKKIALKAEASALQSANEEKTARKKSDSLFNLSEDTIEFLNIQFSQELAERIPIEQRVIIQNEIESYFNTIEDIKNQKNTSSKSEISSYLELRAKSLSASTKIRVFLDSGQKPDNQIFDLAKENIELAKKMTALESSDFSQLEMAVYYEELAELYLLSDETDKAEEIYLNILAETENLLGNNPKGHPDILLAKARYKNKLSRIWFSSGRREYDRMVYAKESLQIRTSVFLYFKGLGTEKNLLYYKSLVFESLVQVGTTHRQAFEEVSLNSYLEGLRLGIDILNDDPFNLKIHEMIVYQIQELFDFNLDFDNDLLLDGSINKYLSLVERKRFNGENSELFKKWYDTVIQLSHKSNLFQSK